MPELDSGGGGRRPLVERFVDTSGDSITVRWKRIATALLSLGVVELVLGWIRLFRSFTGWIGSVGSDGITFVADRLLGGWSSGLVTAITQGLARHEAWIESIGLFGALVVVVELGLTGYLIAWGATTVPGLIRGAFA